MDISLQEHVDRALDALSRAQKTFGSGEGPVAPPWFVTSPDLETDLGAGRF